METSKQIIHLNTLGSSLEKAILGDLEKLSVLLTANYNITPRESKADTQPALVKSSDLLQFLLTQFKFKDKRCCAIIKSGARCSRQIIASADATNAKYCGIHLYKETYDKLNNKLSTSTTETQTESKLIYTNMSSELSRDVEDLKNIFIDDTFYLTDDTYIYDKSTYEKVGYVEKQDDNLVYQLCDDPFILNSF